MTKKLEVIVLGGGCFWCTEAIFKKLKGVINVSPGYAGGDLVAPTYEQVSSGKTGHAEVVKLEYNPAIISLQDILKVFFTSHDPTTPNRQGHDIGSQYRSIILYTNDKQKEIAEKYIVYLEENNFFKNKIITEIKLLKKFYQAEDYHLDYYQKNPYKPYCLLNINPKLNKLKKQFSQLLKK